MRRVTKFIGVVGMGIVIGALGANGLTYIGVNFRLFPYSGHGHTIVAPDQGIHADRVERIFAQFAHQIRLPCSSKEVHKALNATWLKQEVINGIYIITGWIPVETDVNETAFYIDLRSNADDLTGGIYVALSGDEGSADQMTPQQALAFLTGTAPDHFRLKQFALCYPTLPGDPGRGRREIFTWWGIQVIQN